MYLPFKSVIRRLVCLLLFIGFAVAQAEGTDYDWVSGASGSWFTTGNWSGGAVPETGDDANDNTVTLRNGTAVYDSNVTTWLDSLQITPGSGNTTTLNVTAGTLLTMSLQATDTNAMAYINVSNGAALQIVDHMTLGDYAANSRGYLTAEAGSNIFFPAVPVISLGTVELKDGANVHNSGQIYEVTHGNLIIGDVNYMRNDVADTRPMLNIAAGEFDDRTGTQATVTVNGGAYFGGSITGMGNASITFNNVAAHSESSYGAFSLNLLDDASFTAYNSVLDIGATSMIDDMGTMYLHNTAISMGDLHMTGGTIRQDGGSFDVYSAVYMASFDDHNATLDFHNTKVFNSFVKPADEPGVYSGAINADGGNIRLTGTTTVNLHEIVAANEPMNYYQDSRGTEVDYFQASDGSTVEIRGGYFNALEQDGFEVTGSTLTVGGPTTRVSTVSYDDTGSTVNLLLHGQGYNAIRVEDAPTIAANVYNVSDKGVGLMVLNDKTITLMDAALDANHVSYIAGHMNLTGATLFDYSNATDTSGMKIQINDAAIPQTWVQDDEMIFYNDQSLYGEKGSVLIEGEGSILIKFTGVTDAGLSDLLYEYLKANIAGTGLTLSETWCDSAFSLDGNIFSNDGYAYFAWDLTGFNAANTSGVMLYSLEIPEPTTWILLLAGGLAMFFVRRGLRRK